MKAPEVGKFVNKIKKAIEYELDRGNHDMALSLISICANVLYQTNIRYADYDLEYAIARIAQNAIQNISDEFQPDAETVLFWDGFGLNDRGLVQIYIKALCKVKKVVYVTYADCRDRIPDVIDILDTYSAQQFYVDRNVKSPIAMIHQLNQYVRDVNPASMFFYSVPDDVVALPLMYAYEGIIDRYQINLTDHAFWLGAGCCDKCINFRGYGAKISKEYRKIPEKKNVIIPFYPIIHREKQFQGYPFKVKAGQKIIFSGGALYKTLGEGNKYYVMLDYILDKFKNVIFWYAGDGDDSEIRKLISKYPERVYHTKERSDLYQVLEHIDIYLSTYPMCGGLMFQYAAMAGVVPVTLKHGNISDDFLIDQQNIQIEFETEDVLYQEVEKLLMDEEYALGRSELMKKSVIAPEMFEEEVRKLICAEESNLFNIDYEHIDTEEFRQWYLEKLTVIDVLAMAVRKNDIRAAIKHYPIEFLRVIIYLAKKVIKRKLLQMCFFL